MEKNIHSIVFRLFLVLVSVLFLFRVNPVRAEWTKQPITFHNEFAEWKEIGKYQPSVMIEDGVYKMWFATYDGSSIRIGYATSPDGLSWVNHGPVLSVPDMNIHDPAVIHGEDGYVMWFAGDLPNTPGIRIFRAISPDGIAWQVNPATPVLEPIPGTWNANTVTSPFVTSSEGGYAMLFSGHNTMWGVGAANSPDGINWLQSMTNPLLPGADGASMLRVASRYELYFHRYGMCGQGIYRVWSTDGLLWQGTSNPDPVICAAEDYGGILTAPSVVTQGDEIAVYYTEIDPVTYGNILLVVNKPDLPTSTTPTPAPSFTPTPSPSIIPTPTQTATPTPITQPEQGKLPVVLIPGLFGSWNRDAVLHDMPVDYNRWGENPIVREYDGVKKTFSRLGYERNKDFFLFSYDWRKQVISIVDDLAKYMRDTVVVSGEARKINIIGHSLGGIIARIYAQKYGTDQINKIVTVGTPHKGTAKVYKPLMTGEIENENSFFWLAQRVILELYRQRGESTQNVLAHHFPVLQDLLPTYPYLNGISPQPYSSLLTGFSDMNTIENTLITGGSNDYGTLFGYVGYNSHTLKPVQKQGDGVILAESALVSKRQIKLKGNHGEIIYTKGNIAKILNELEIDYTPDKLVSGSGADIFPSAILLVRSPVRVTVVHDGKTYQEKEGILVIPGEPQGKYEIRTLGIGKGDYTIHFGLFSKTLSQWRTFKGTVRYLKQQNSHTVKVSQTKPCSDKNK